MGCLYQPSIVSLPPDPNKLPFNEWFDDEPITEITGENTTDPKLLGIPEHVPAAREPEKK